jgi:inositol hexakisphosphate/diphosphoinositol-pentakisphosphate kinase
MDATADDVNRVKLPKSFLAVNLSESHTFHKKDGTEEKTTLDEATQTAEGTGESQAQADDLFKT